MGAEVTDMSIPFQFVGALAIAGSTFMSIVQVMPQPSTRDFFEVAYITGKRIDHTAVLDVNRTIKAPLHMSFTVRVMEQEAKGWSEFCSMSTPGAILYDPDNRLPEPVTLDWWTWGECAALPDGPARIITTWTPTPPGFQPVTAITDIP